MNWELLEATLAATVLFGSLFVALANFIEVFDNDFDMTLGPEDEVEEYQWEELDAKQIVPTIESRLHDIDIAHAA